MECLPTSSPRKLPSFVAKYSMEHIWAICFPKMGEMLQSSMFDLDFPKPSMASQATSEVKRYLVKLGGNHPVVA